MNIADLAYKLSTATANINGLGNMIQKLQAEIATIKKEIDKLKQ